MLPRLPKEIQKSPFANKAHDRTPSILIRLHRPHQRKAHGVRNAREFKFGKARGLLLLLRWEKKMLLPPPERKIARPSTRGRRKRGYRTSGSSLLKPFQWRNRVKKLQFVVCDRSCYVFDATRCHGLGHRG